MSHDWLLWNLDAGLRGRLAAGELMAETFFSLEGGGLWGHVRMGNKIAVCSPDSLCLLPSAKWQAVPRVSQGGVISDAPYQISVTLIGRKLEITPTHTGFLPIYGNFVSLFR